MTVNVSWQLGAIPYRANYLSDKENNMPHSDEAQKHKEHLAQDEETKQQNRINGVRAIIETVLIVIALVVACIVATVFIQDIYRLARYGG